MGEQKVLRVAELPPGSKKVVKVNGLEILLVREEGRGETVFAIQPKCPHAQAPLEQGAVCNGRLVCPWHMGTFILADGALLEPPPLQGLTTYQARIEDDSILVDPAPLAPAVAAPQTSDSPDTRRFLFAGGGAATAAALSALRQGGFRGHVTIVDPVENEPVDRTQLSKMALSGKASLDKLSLWKAGDLSDIAIERETARVNALDAQGRTVRLEDGRTLHFDAAMIATGGVPRRLEVPGAELSHVSTIRHVGDVAAILAQAKEGARAVIIGSSFIAMEAASALTEKSLSVTVVSGEKLPFAKQFGEAPAKALLALHQRQGVQFHLKAEIKSIQPGSVTLGGGEKLPADLVILGVGVSPATQFEHDLPRGEDGSIAVDSSLRAAENVWVAGDIASVNGTRIEHWRVAEQHGVVAARGMLGENARYEGVPFFWTFHFGKRLGYLGHAKEWDDILVEGDLHALKFLAFYTKDGRVEAVLSCGRDTATAALAEVMRARPTLVEARSAVVSLLQD